MFRLSSRITTSAAAAAAAAGRSLTPSVKSSFLIRQLSSNLNKSITRCNSITKVGYPTTHSRLTPTNPASSRECLMSTSTKNNYRDHDRMVPATWFIISACVSYLLLDILEPKSMVQSDFLKREVAPHVHRLFRLITGQPEPPPDVTEIECPVTGKKMTVTPAGTHEFTSTPVAPSKNSPVKLKAALPTINSSTTTTAAPTVPTTATPITATSTPTPATTQPTSAATTTSATSVTESSTSSAITASSTSPKDLADESEDARMDELLKSMKEEGFSAEPKPESGRPFIRNIVASEIPKLIEERKDDVLLQIYAEWCGACRMISPVVDTVATVMNEIESKQSTADPGAVKKVDIPHVTVMQMDGDANFQPGFLTPEENRALPLVKFFPKCGSKLFSDEIRSKKECQPVLFEGRPNVQAMVEFIYQQLKQEPKVDPSQPNKIIAPTSVTAPLDQYHELGAAHETATREKVMVALIKRFEADANQMPALRVHGIAPCGHHLEGLMKRMMMSGYQSYHTISREQDEKEGSDLHAAYRRCAEEKEEELKDFWEQVKLQTDDALKAIEHRRKEREEEEAEEAKEQAAAAATIASNTASSTTSTPSTTASTSTPAAAPKSA